MLHFAPREDEVFYDVVAIVDPVTRDAQKMSPLLIVSSAPLFPLSPIVNYDYVKDLQH